MMVMETWVFVAIAGDGESPLGDAAILRLFRLLRLSRLLRMMRSLPELMILIKGMVTAMQSVVYVMLLLLVVTYVFAIACTQLSDGTEFKETYFAHVALSMYSLMVYATFLDNLADFCEAIRAESPVVLFVVSVFICLSALTVMNMLIGVLCEVIEAVAETEREEMLVQSIGSTLGRILKEIDENGNGTISFEEFKKILQIPDALRALQDVGVDPVGAVDFAEMFFVENGKFIELSFGRFMELMLDLRSTNVATVKDIMNLWKQAEWKIQECDRETKRNKEKLEDLAFELAELKRSVARIEGQLAAVVAEVQTLVKAFSYVLQ
eukprot:TRINITY_DN9276_c0_g2_i1.p1 TRINITY_DN9276_c0_g2~~TRINITY_DN9276_c0_g2_i1.p1  ORF type:complete len:323 (+),score=99.26 TRINITY_DN9276_c0_g2_i1:2-970(+)